MAIARKLLGLLLIIGGYCLLTLFVFVGVEHAPVDARIKVMIAAGRVLQGLITLAVGARLLSNNPIRAQRNEPKQYG